MGSAMRPRSATLALLSASIALPAAARADVQHVVARGHTVEAIANRYHVSAKAILEANHLKDPRRLRAGDVLTIPKADGGKGKPEAGKGKVDAAKKGDAKLVKVAAKKEQVTYAARPKTPHVVHLKRIATTEEADLRVKDGRGRVPASTLKAFEKMLRSPSGLAHPIEPRLVALLGVVSNHFGSRKIEVVSGFRPYTPTQFTPHSNHNHGKAIDFRVVGVPNEAVRDFCRTLKNVGCGYYPNSTFVHMDVREQSAFWVDYSRPGESPRYNAPGLDADEGTSDVHDEQHVATGTTPDDAKPAAAPEGGETKLPSLPAGDDTPAAAPEPPPAD